MNHQKQSPKAHPTATQTPKRRGEGDHAFPMLASQKSAMPPHFRFMWVAR